MKTFIKIISILFCIINCQLSIIKCIAQPTNNNCAQMKLLCANQTDSANNIKATAQCAGVEAGCKQGAWNGGLCYDINNSVWFKFTTNNIGDSATVTISNIACTKGDSLQGTLISATSLCIDSTYNVLDCQTGNATAFSLTYNNLDTFTTYIVHIDGVNGAECNFDIVVTGTAVDYTVTTSTTTASCGENDGTATVTVVGRKPPFTYLWDDTKKQKTATATGLAAGTYNVTVKGDNNCIDTALIVNIPQPSTPTAILSVNHLTCESATGSITVNASGGTIPYSYTFNGASPGLQTFTTTKKGNYEVKVTDKNNCTYTDTVEIEDKCEEQAIEVPDAFSPNGDGLNDLWQIGNIYLYPSCKVFVYDRWGQKVYSSKGKYDDPWDGNSLGYPVPAATYYYVIELTKRDGTKVPVTGYVAIVR